MPRSTRRPSFSCAVSNEFRGDIRTRVHPRLMDCNDVVLIHRSLGGKSKATPRKRIQNRADEECIFEFGRRVARRLLTVKVCFA